MKKANDIRNVDTAILSMAQLIQPCLPENLIARAKTVLRESSITKREIQNRVNSLEKNGFLWSRMDKFLLVTAKGDLFSKTSMPPGDRDKFRLLLLNKSRYNSFGMDT